MLQYLVAVAFSLRTSPGEFSGASLLKTLPPAGDSDTYLSLNRYRSFGREILDVRFAHRVLYELDSRVPTATKPSWTNGYWLDLNAGETPMFNAEPPAQRLPNPAPPWSHLSTISEDPEYDYYPSAGGVECIEGASGWPMRSASYFAEFPPPSDCVIREGLLIEGVGGDVMLPRVIPLRIYWPGALANTLIYAAALLVPFTVVPVLRRHLRRRRGHCPACNYDLRATTTGVCPECGAPA